MPRAFWQSCFLTVNLVNLLILLYSMRPPNFDSLEAQVHKLKFSDLKHHEAAPFFKLARRMTSRKGELLLKDGDSNNRLFLIVEGSCRIMKNETEIAVLTAGRFVGELSFVSGEVISATLFPQKTRQSCSGTGMHWNLCSKKTAYTDLI